MFIFGFQLLDLFEFIVVPLLFRFIYFILYRLFFFVYFSMFGWLVFFSFQSFSICVCVYFFSAAIHEFPRDYFTNQERVDGAVGLHVLCVSVTCHTVHTQKIVPVLNTVPAYPKKLMLSSFVFGKASLKEITKLRLQKKAQSSKIQFWKVI